MNVRVLHYKICENADKCDRKLPDNTTCLHGEKHESRYGCDGFCEHKDFEPDFPTCKEWKETQ